MISPGDSVVVVDGGAAVVGGATLVVVTAGGAVVGATVVVCDVPSAHAATTRNSPVSKIRDLIQVKR
jgi:hypothetical protein